MIQPLGRVVDFVGRLSKATVLLLGIALAIGLGVIDNATGFEISFALFYLLPVFLVAWSRAWKPPKRPTRSSPQPML